MAKEIKLSPTERKQWNTLIQTRVKTMLAALDNQIGISIDQIISNLRTQNNITMTTDQIDSLVEEVNKQIREQVATHIAEVRRAVQIEVVQAGDDFDRQEREMKERHSKEWQELVVKRKATEQTLKDRIKNAEEEVARTHTAELLERKRGYMSEKARVSEIEMKITTQADAQFSMMNSHKNTLRNMITDSGNRATEQLMMIDTKEQAQQLLISIPTVEEAVALCRTSNGIQTLFKRLKTPLLAGPAPVTVPDEPVAQAETIDEIPPKIATEENGEVKIQILEGEIMDFGESAADDIELGVNEFASTRNHAREVYGTNSHTRE